MNQHVSKKGSKHNRNLEIRVATAGDVSLILQFIRKLAHYERLSHEVTATEEILRRNLFEGKRVAEVILAEYQHTAVGFALYFYNFSTFLGRSGIYIEDLYVDEPYRGSGVGRTMFLYIVTLARERGCGRVEWSVLDWNRPAIKFYESLGARPMSDWTNYRLSGEALEKLRGAP